jgi:hypothetical protein
MGRIGGHLGYQLLRYLSPKGKDTFRSGSSEEAHADACKLELRFVSQIWDELKDKVVLDFGLRDGD